MMLDIEDKGCPKLGKGYFAYVGGNLLVGILGNKACLLCRAMATTECQMVWL